LAFSEDVKPLTNAQIKANRHWRVIKANLKEVIEMGSTGSSASPTTSIKAKGKAKPTLQPLKEE